MRAASGLIVMAWSRLAFLSKTNSAMCSTRRCAVLGLNEVGLCALGVRRYPLPEISALPFCVWPLRMPHGIGFANAYLVSECSVGNAVLFDNIPNP